MRNCDLASATFRTAGGGNLKCNKCGEVLTKQGAKRHRNSHAENTRHSEKKLSAPAVVQEHRVHEPMWKAHIRGRGFVGHNFAHCPYCDHMHSGRLLPNSTVICGRCNRRFLLIE